MRQVDYQKDQPDALHHRYTYDADNRITEVETSADAQNWHTDARYFYYPHGPLQRVELGEHLVQGTDYAYTLQGWLKGINGDRLNPTTDMGRDGDATVMSNPNLLTGRDAYALSLGYYGDNDYKAITPSWSTVTTRAFAPVGASGTLNTEHTPLYNGNIAHTVNTLQHFGLWDATNGDQGQVLAMVYRYDQLNRLRTAHGLVGLNNTNTWNGVNDAATNRYRSEYTYDANGNIETVQRWNATGTARYDSLHYHYHDAGGRRLRNRLYHLQDLAADGIVTAPDPDDLKKTTLAVDTNLGTLNTNASTNNYRYDALGNLVYDNREGISKIEWTVAGKVRSVAKASGPSLAFAYGASGQRTQKQVGDPALDPTAYREHYIRDAQGNIMATYRYTNNTAASLKLNERPLYGSSRLGSLREEVELHTLAAFDPATANPVQMVDLNYELTDHLGNVCAVVTGRLLDGNGGGTAKQAELVSAQGYEPFGSLLPGRNYSSSSYRFGFNGAEKNDEVHGATGTSYTFEARMHDPRVGRWLSLDPLAFTYTALSPYCFTGNNPIMMVEVDGQRFEYVNKESKQLYKSIFRAASKERRAELRLLKKSDVIYRVNVGGTTGKADLSGSTLWNPTESATRGKTVIDINVDANDEYGKVAALGDELKHAHQFEKGKIGFAERTNGLVQVIGYDSQDEAESQDASVDALRSLGFELTGAELDWTQRSSDKAFFTKYDRRFQYPLGETRDGDTGRSPADLKKFMKDNGMSKALFRKQEKRGSDKMKTVNTDATQ